MRGGGELLHNNVGRYVINKPLIYTCILNIQHYIFHIKVGGQKL